jgi:hypothetical protein
VKCFFSYLLIQTYGLWKFIIVLTFGIIKVTEIRRVNPEMQATLDTRKITMENNTKTKHIKLKR